MCTRGACQLPEYPSTGSWRLQLAVQLCPHYLHTSVNRQALLAPQCVAGCVKQAGVYACRHCQQHNTRAANVLTAQASQPAQPRLLGHQSSSPLHARGWILCGSLGGACARAANTHPLCQTAPLLFAVAVIVLVVVLAVVGGIGCLPGRISCMHIAWQGLQDAGRRQRC